MSKKVRLGIIGIGNMGSAHARNIFDGKCPEIELTAVADIDEAKLAEAKKNYPDADKIGFFNTAEALMESGLCDAVHICVPHYDHPSLAIAAMKHGLHVMVEKPAGVYTKQVEEMNSEAKKHPDLVFAMMFNQRTNCVYRKMRELVKSGKYGSLRRANWIITNWYRPQCYYDSGAWRATWSGEGGGVLLNQCPHQLDLFQWICGMPVKVSAQLQYGKWHNIEVEDDVTAYVEFPNGSTGVFVTSTGDACGTNRFEILLDKAKIIVEDEKLRVWELDCAEPEFTKTCTAPFGCPKATEISVETDGKNEQHVGVLNAFAAAILRGEPLIADGSEGINGLTLSNAMHLSSWLGREVDIPFDADLYYDELQKRVKTSKRKTEVKSVTVDLSNTYSGNDGR